MPDRQPGVLVPVRLDPDYGRVHYAPLCTRSYDTTTLRAGSPVCGVDRGRDYRGCGCQHHTTQPPKDPQ